MVKCKNLYIGCLVFLLFLAILARTGPANASDMAVNIQVQGNMDNIEINSGNVQNNGGCLHGNGTVKKSQRPLKGFNKIKVHGVFNLHIRQQKNFEVEISCDANLYQHIQTRVADHMLDIDTDRSICPKRPIDIRVGLPEFLELNALGADDIIVSDLDNKQFHVTVDGSSDIKITGRTATLTADLNGAGDLEAFGLRAETVLVTSRGAGDATVHADKEIKAVLDGAGDVTYLGSPDRVIQKGNGIGDLSAE